MLVNIDHSVHMTENLNKLVIINSDLTPNAFCFAPNIKTVNAHFLSHMINNIVKYNNLFSCSRVKRQSSCKSEICKSTDQVTVCY